MGITSIHLVGDVIFILCCIKAIPVEIHTPTSERLDIQSSPQDLWVTDINQ